MVCFIVSGFSVCGGGVMCCVVSVDWCVKFVYCESLLQNPDGSEI